MIAASGRALRSNITDMTLGLEGWVDANRNLVSIDTGRDDDGANRETPEAYRDCPPLSCRVSLATEEEGVILLIGRIVVHLRMWCQHLTDARQQHSKTNTRNVTVGHRAN